MRHLDSTSQQTRLISYKAEHQTIGMVSLDANMRNFLLELLLKDSASFLIVPKEVKIYFQVRLRVDEITSRFERQP